MEAAGLVLRSLFAVGGKESIKQCFDLTSNVRQTCEDGGGGRPGGGSRLLSSRGG